MKGSNQRPKMAIETHQLAQMEEINI